MTAIAVMIYQSLLDFRTGMLNREVTYLGIAAVGISFAGVDSLIKNSFAPLVLSLVTGITAYYFFTYTVYRMGLIGGGDVRVMYSLGFMFPALADVPFLINKNYLFGVKETWPYLSMYFNLIIIAGFFVIFETLIDCWKFNKIKPSNPDIKYLFTSLIFFTVSTIMAFVPVSMGAGIESDIHTIADYQHNFYHIIHALVIIFTFVIGIYSLKKFSKDILRKKLKIHDLLDVKHPILSSQYVIEVNNELKTVNDTEMTQLKRQTKKCKNGFDIIVEKNTVIPRGIVRKLASMAPDMEMEIKTAKPRTIYLLFVVILLPLGDIFTILNRIIMGW